MAKRYITFSDGHRIVTSLSLDAVTVRMHRLDTLRVLTEGYDDGEGANIFKKAFRAYNKEEFTGVIRLTAIEKDFLGYMLDDPYLDDDEKAVVEFYIR